MNNFRYMFEQKIIFKVFFFGKNYHIINEFNGSIIIPLTLNSISWKIMEMIKKRTILSCLIERNMRPEIAHMNCIWFVIRSNEQVKSWSLHWNVYHRIVSRGEMTRLSGAYIFRWIRALVFECAPSNLFRTRTTTQAVYRLSFRVRNAFNRFRTDTQTHTHTDAIAAT